MTKTMRREDVPPSWGGPAVPMPPPQQHQFAEHAEFGKRTLRHIRHENDTYYLVQFPLAQVLRLRHKTGIKRAGTSPQDHADAALRRLSNQLRYGRMACGCIGVHHWFAPCNPFAQNDYEVAGV